MADVNQGKEKYAVDEYIQRINYYVPSPEQPLTDLKIIFESAHEFTEMMNNLFADQEIDITLSSLFFDKSAGDVDYAANMLRNYMRLKSDNPLSTRIDWEVLFNEDGKPSENEFVTYAYLDESGKHLDPLELT